MPLHPDDLMANACADLRAIAALLRLLSVEEGRAIISETEVSHVLMLATDTLHAAMTTLEDWRRCQ